MDMHASMTSCGLAGTGQKTTTQGRGHTLCVLDSPCGSPWVARLSLLGSGLSYVEFLWRSTGDIGDVQSFDETKRLCRVTRRPGIVVSRIGESRFVTVEGIPEDEIVKIGFSDLGEIEREREICIASQTVSGAEDDRQSRKCGLDSASCHPSGTMS